MDYRTMNEVDTNGLVEHDNSTLVKETSLLFTQLMQGNSNMRNPEMAINGGFFASNHSYQDEDLGSAPLKEEKDLSGDKSEKNTPFDNSPENAAEENSKKRFKIDKSRLHAVSEENQSGDLAGLGLTVYNQEELEQDIIAQVDDAMEEEIKERQTQLIQKKINCVNDDINSCLQELQKSEKVLQLLSGDGPCSSIETKNKILSVRKQIDLKLKQLTKLRVKKKSLKQTLCYEMDRGQNGKHDTEAKLDLDLDEKVRKGEMTPFGTIVEQKNNGNGKTLGAKITLSENSAFDNFLLNSKSKKDTKLKNGLKKKVSISVEESKDLASKTNVPKTDSSDSKDERINIKSEKECRSLKKRKKKYDQPSYSNTETDSDGEICDDYINKNSDSDYIPDEKEEMDGDMYSCESEIKDRNKSKSKRKSDSFNDDFFPVKRKKGMSLEKLNSKDDGDIDNYEARLHEVKRDKAKKRYDKLQNGEEESEDSDFELDDGFKVPGSMWNKLYPFQKTGVRWLWELHCQETGGIVGDEMGLGKTIQMVTFLAGLAHSKMKDKASKYHGLGPTIIVAPTTVLHQWVKEFHKWAPYFRVAVLHNTGSYTSSEESLVYSIIKSKGILITAFSSVVIYQEILLKYNWHYVVLDEGHKIRNPDAQVTIACKQFRTCHRIILSGSPIQNNLKELWSLFDFVFPGKLGTLPDFMAHFSVPIVQGGYANASQVQVQTAFKCASILRDTINPYLLRRMKSDVKDSLELPSKNEQVLFCRLTDHQKQVYQEYIDSRECKEILKGNFMVFPGLITLRKICNHPDLCTGGINQFDPNYLEMSEEEKTFGHYGRSGKMMVVRSLLRLWHKQGHRVLLFSQGTQMLNLLQGLVNDEGYTCMRMDGSTSIGSRQGLIDKFNKNSEIFIFLLTTRVGGLGVNLCGANRVILFDPDWNPSTDTQARERAWRIGQNKQVTIYRLLTSGTIEEKIYHRQIFKQFLTNRVLKDPKQRRFFKSNDLFELFTLGSDDNNHGTETGAIFAGTGSVVSLKSGGAKDHTSVKVEALPIKRKNRFDEMKAKGDESHLELDCDEEDKKDKDVQERLNKMREFAKRLSRQMEEEKLKIESGTSFNKSETGVVHNSVEASGEKAGKKKHSKKSNIEHKKKKKRRHKDIVFEGEKISHLCKHSTFKTAEDEEVEKSKQDDDYVLQKLFKKSGVHSALQHDTIMMSSNPDYALVEGEAEKVAKEAAAALKKSRARCHTASSGIPTWTGQSGGTSKPRFGQKKNPVLKPSSESKPDNNKKTAKSKESKKDNLFDGSVAGNVKVTSSQSQLNVMSSNELLQKMKQRNILNKSNTEEDEDSNIVPDVNDESMEFITDIRNFIAFQTNTSGQATTQELLEEFSSKVPNSDSAKFRAMLREICTFRKFEDVGIWRLRSEFR